MRALDRSSRAADFSWRLILTGLFGFAFGLIGAILFPLDGDIF
jgi:hypothetical protein